MSCRRCLRSFARQLVNNSRTRRGMVGGDSNGRSDPITEVFDGRHELIVARATWDNVQEKMQLAQRQQATRWTHTHLLKGRLATFEDSSMSPCTVRKPARGEPSRQAGSGLEWWWVDGPRGDSGGTNRMAEMS